MLFYVQPIIQRTFVMERLLRLRALLPLLLLAVVLAGCGSQTQVAAAAPASAAGAAGNAKAPPLPDTAAVVSGPADQQGIMPERLLIPRIDVDTPVVELGWSTQKNQEGQIFSEWDVPEYAAGWHKNSALLNTPGNVVMSGHNNILGAVFRELDQLRRGDAITVQGGGRSFEYVVHDVLIVPEKFATLERRKENARWIGQFDDDRLTLVSCWPRDDNTHRIIVVAFPKEQ
jgi:LPXTG-site transpeptidase (sortase) family protein